MENKEENLVNPDGYKSTDGYLNVNKNEEDKNDEHRKYIFNISNDSDETKKCVLFGMNVFIKEPNFGSDNSITIDVSVSIHPKGEDKNIGYLELLKQSHNKPFSVALLRIDSENITQRHQVIKYYDNKKDTSIEIYPQEYSNGNIFGKIIDMPCRELNSDTYDSINGNTYISFSVLPKEKLKISFFSEGKCCKNRKLC